MNGMIFGQGGFSPDGKTPVLGGTGVPTTSYQNAVNITGSGYLLSIGGVGISGSAGGYLYWKVIVDGVACGTDIPVGRANDTGVGCSSLFAPIRFETSLVLQYRVSNYTGFNGNYAYLLD